jgi:hypothetical protein
MVSCAAGTVAAITLAINNTAKATLLSLLSHARPRLPVSLGLTNHWRNCHAHTKTPTTNPDLMSNCCPYAVASKAGQLPTVQYAKPSPDSKSSSMPGKASLEKRAKD